MNEALKKLLMNEEDLYPLAKWVKRVNIFDIIRNAKTEIRHSNMLAWLLNVNENHGLGDAFVRRFITSVIKANEEKECCPKIQEWAFLNYDEQIVKNEENYMDILIRFEGKDEKAIIVIENKLFSKEHNAGKSDKKQTIEYRERVEKEYKCYKKMFVFLTPDGISCDDGAWCLLSYDSILEDILAIISQFEASPYVEMILQNYCDILRRIIDDDPELNDLCDVIYQNHKQAINLLAESRKNASGLDAELQKDCDRIYSRYQKELDLIFANTTDEKAVIAKKLSAFDWRGAKVDKKASGKTYVRFAIPELDEKIPLLKEENGSWKTQHTYYFWFGTYNYNKGKLNFVFELGLKNRTDEIKEIHDRLIEKMSPNTQTGEKYKRLKSVTIKIDKESTPDEIVAKAIEVAQKKAEEWYADISKALVKD